MLSLPQESRSRSTTSCLTIQSEIPVDLKRDKLEGTTSNSLNTSSCVDILDTLSPFYNGERIDEAGIDPTAKDNTDEGEMNATEAAEAFELENNNEVNNEPAPHSKIQKKTMHRFIDDDVWSIGLEKMKKKDVVAVRAEKARVRQLRNVLREAIINTIKDKSLNANEVEMHIEIDVDPGFRRRMRIVDNNII